MSKLSLHAGLGLGYSVITVSGPQPSTDPSVFVGRAALGLQLQLWRMLWVRIDGAATAYLLRVDGREQAQFRPEGLAGLIWQAWQ